MTVRMPIPTVLWAQRKDKLFITIDVQDVKDQKIDLDNVDGCGKLTFAGKGGSEDTEYALDLVLNKAIDVEASKVAVTGRNIFVVVAKPKDAEGHWDRLTKDSGRHLSHIKCDWNKWVDEDEEDEDKFDMSGMDFSGFGGGGGGMGGMGGMAGMMGGMGGMGGMDMEALAKMGGMGGGDDDGDDDDSDNDDLPDLVK